jgi:osmotically-inducible protein OsmY
MEHFHFPASSLTDAQRLLATQSALRNSGYQSLSRVSCEIRGGKVVLTGEVPSYYVKQLAQTIVQRLVFVEHVENRLEVICVEDFS